MKWLDEIHVMGKCSLSGEIFIQGSKNAALPMMAASLMHRGRSVLKGCPRISDVFCMEEVLKSLGAVTWWEDHDLYLDCSDADGTEIPETYTRRMRSSIILLGPVLSRNKKCRIGYPGGCIIGKRPIDLHLMAIGRTSHGSRSILDLPFVLSPLSFQVLQKTKASIHFIRFMDLCLYNRLIAIGRTSLYHGILSFNSRISRPTQQFSQCTFRRSIFYVIVRHEPHFRCGISNEFLGSNRYLAILLQTKYRR